MASISKIQNKRTNTPNRKPSVGLLAPGEIAINYAKGSEAIYIENDAKEIVEFKTGGTTSNGEGVGTVTWNDVTDKPSMFTPTPNAEKNNVLSPDTIFITDESRTSIAGHIDCNSDGLMEFSTNAKGGGYLDGVHENGIGYRFNIGGDSSTVMSIKDKQLTFGTKEKGEDLDTILSVKPNSINFYTYYDSSNGDGGATISINKGIKLNTFTDEDNVIVTSGEFKWKSHNNSGGNFILNHDNGGKMSASVRAIDMKGSNEVNLRVPITDDQTYLKLQGNKVTMRANSDSQFRVEEENSVFVGKDIKLIFKETNPNTEETTDKKVYLKSFIEQLYYVESNDFEYVDLGLPSGLLWAKYNVGSGYGFFNSFYFAWGETDRYYDGGESYHNKTTFEWDDYSLCRDERTMTKYCTDSSYGLIDLKTTLDLEDDAARSYFGSVWRMPSQVEFQELMDNCTIAWQTNYPYGDKLLKNGLLFTSKNNGNQIFLPALGGVEGNIISNFNNNVCTYWTNTLYQENNKAIAYTYTNDKIVGGGFDILALDKGDVGGKLEPKLGELSPKNRCLGYPIRPVIEPHFAVISGGDY